MGRKAKAPPLRLIVTGIAEYKRFGFLEAKLDQITFKCRRVVVLTTGAKGGVEELARKWAFKNWYTVMNYYAEKGSDNPAAARNRKLCEEADALVAFYDGKFQPTKNLIECARHHNLQVRIIKVDNGNL